MKKNCCLYFVAPSTPPPGGLLLRRGYGFRADGSWRAIALPEEAAGLVIDDRYLPSSAGLETARRALSACSGLILLDFERPPSPLLIRLAECLSGRRVAVPAAYATCPHSEVLVGPWQGRGSFRLWLEAQRETWGSLILDGAPIRLRVYPGQDASLSWSDSLPQTGFPCPDAFCLHRRLKDGSILFWDTAESLTARCLNAGVPTLVFPEDWSRLRPPLPCP